MYSEQLKTIKEFSTIIGHSERDIRMNIKKGVWLYGKHYKTSSNNRFFIQMSAFEDLILNNHTKVNTGKK